MPEDPKFVRLTAPFTRHHGEMLIFPIIKALYYSDGSELHKLIGTGFFIASRRFLTARHVFQGKGSAVDLEGAAGFAVYCVHTVDLQRRPVARHIDLTSILTRKETDIATGVVELDQFGKGDPTIRESDLANTGFINQLTTDPVPVGTPIYTVAYPLATVSMIAPKHVHIHSQSDSFEGRITRHYPSGRDSSLITWPCYETDMDVKGGASGGPVFIAGSSGVVFAVNCTGTDPHCVSHVTSLSTLKSPDVTEERPSHVL